MRAHTKFLLTVVAVSLFAGLPSTRGADDVAEVQALIAKLKDKDEGIRFKAAKDLGKLKEKAKAAVPALTAALRDSDEDVRAVAKKALESIHEGLGDEGKLKINEALAPLIKSLQAKDPKVRMSTLEQLGEMGKEARPAGAAIVEFGMMHPSEKVKEAAAAAMEKIDPEVYKEVLTVLIDDDYQHKHAAILTLSSMGARAKASSPAFKGYMTSLSANPRNSHVMFSVLNEAMKIDPNDLTLRALVLGAVGAGDAAIGSRGQRDTFRDEAISLMNTSNFDSKHKYAALMKGLSVSTADRSIIIVELGRLGADAKAAIPTLTRLKLDPDLAVRQAATNAIDAIKD